MATYAEKLARSLEIMNAAQQDGIVRSERITRTHQERLVNAGFLQEALRGWYFVASPSVATGSTAWYGHYWAFVRQYLTGRFGDGYCLHPEASLRLLTGSAVVPGQLLVLCRPPGAQLVRLPLGTSLYIYQDAGNFPEAVEIVNGIRVMPLAQALQRLPETYYQNAPDDAVVALRLVRDVTPLLRDLLEAGKTTIAGRLAGALRHIGDGAAADRIIRSMQSAGHNVREYNPFQVPAPAPLLVRTVSPYVARLQGMWASLRGDVESLFPSPAERTESVGEFLARVDEQYTQDAYHSLSIEGYRVSPELIERVRRGDWNPDAEPGDRQGSDAVGISVSDALAARGYLEAFTAVKGSIERILKGANASSVLRSEHPDWYQALFAPSVRAGFLSPATLAGYRAGQVYIHGSRHVPLPAHAVGDAMETLFDLVASEENAAVRAVLGHFLFVYIHPYSDGNGRMARFLMNALFAGGGFPWTVIHLGSRDRYMSALESASVDGDIKPFAACVLEEMGANK